MSREISNFDAPATINELSPWKYNVLVCVIRYGGMDSIQKHIDESIQQKEEIVTLNKWYLS